MPELTAQRLRELLRYDADTGVFTWLKKPNPKANNHVGGVQL